jgi:hypothetical protein
MGLSAFTDGTLTLLLIVRFIRSRPPSTPLSASSVITRLITLTLETVLLTHIVGASMCVIFLASPPSRRTQHPLFWILLEVITELYALSILFTINARRPAKEELDGMSGGGRTESDGVRGSSASELDRRVEGYQGSTPFGVRIAVPTLGYQGGMEHIQGSSEGSSREGMSSGQGSSDQTTPFKREEEKGWDNFELNRLDTRKDQIES